MKALLIDTSSEYLYVIVYDTFKKTELINKSMVTHNNHSENLIPVIESALNELNITLSDIDEFICGIGPGSYTGLRVGCVVSKMASYTLNKTQKIVSSLLFVSSGKLDSDGKYLVKMKAKKDYSYYLVLEVKDKVINVLVSDSFTSDEELNNIINSYDNLIIIDEALYKPSGEVIYNYAKEVSDIHSLTPNYLRKANS